MKMKMILVSFIAAIFLAGCGQQGAENSFALMDHTGSEVVFPQEKPVLFFFITTYT